jgi:hypothetical protein
MSFSSGPKDLFIPSEPGPVDPSDFPQRGGVVAFTSPHLLGARFIQAAKGGQRDLALSNLSTRSGLNVVPWSKVATAQGMTMHDQALWEKLLDLPAVTPSHIRAATLEIAALGLRGSAARNWARDHQTQDRTALRRVFFLQLTDLIRRTEWIGEEKVAPEDESLSYLRPRIGRAIGRISKTLGVKTEETEKAVEILASVFMPFGKPHDFVIGHTRQALLDLQRFVRELENWTAQRRGSPRGSVAEFVLRKADLALRCAEAAMADIDELADDTSKLLRHWVTDPQSVRNRAARPEWLLNGWDIVIALWRQSEPSDREACFLEMSHLAPSLPKEVETWLGFPEDGSKIRLAPPPPFDGLDWRASRPLEFAARNEALLCGTHAVKLDAEAQKLRESFMVRSALAITDKLGKEPLNTEAVASISRRTSVASDTVLRQVVAVLEAVPSRQELDPIIEAVRPRLKLLRPPRTLTFARILFLPFDGAFVPDKTWKTGSARFPRPALMPIAYAIREAMGPAAEEISANLSGRNFLHVLELDDTGRTLWAEAARLAPKLQFPKDSVMAGLGAEQCKELLETAAAIWRHANAIWEAKLASFSGPSAELVINALRGPAKEGAAVFGMALLSLLHQAHSPGSVLSTAARLSPLAGSIADEKLEELVGLPVPALPIEDPVRAAHVAEEYVLLLKELESAPAGRLKNRRELIAPLIEKIGKAAETTATQIVENQFLPALEDPNVKRRAAIVVNIEHLARSLRRLEDAGRRAGQGEAFSILQQRTAQKLRITLRVLDGGGFLPVEISRIAEILLGTETAMAMEGPGT